MPVNDSSEFDYTPGYTKPTHEYGQPYGDEFHAEAVQELLFSVNAGYTQRGVTLLGGQGVLPTGAILARESTSGCYVLYKSGGSNGVGTAVGILRDARDTGGAGGTGPLVGPSGNVSLTGGPTFSASPAGKAATMAQANIVYRGVLNANLVSGTDAGGVTTGPQGVATATLTALGARVVQLGGGQGAFPGGPMDGQVAGETAGLTVNAFIF
jgi:hypothetical protein